MTMTGGFGTRSVPAEGRSLIALSSENSTNNGAGASDPGHLETKERVRGLLMARINPTVAAKMKRPQLLAQIHSLVNQIADQTRVRLNEREEMNLASELVDDMIGLGPLEPLLADDAINDVLVNGPGDVYIERYGKLEKTPVQFRDAAHLLNVAQRIATAVGRRIDEASPMVDARLADGSRVNIVIPPVVLNGGTISIRKFSQGRITLDTMVAQGNLSKAMARFLAIAAQARLNILISGGTGSGKTTLLNAMSRFINGQERVITIEDAAELRLQQPHVVSMETRTENVEGTGRIVQRDLLRNALRMRPDRIIVGEVRGEEAFDMLQAMNTGHDGSMSTIHANSPRDSLFRLENMVLMGSVNLPLRAIRAQIAGAINLLIHIERMRDGMRRVTRVAEIVGMESDVVTMQDVFTFHQGAERRDGKLTGNFEATGYRPHCIDRVAAFGLARQLLDAIETAQES